MPEESVIKRHYFDPGVTLHTLAPGHEMRIPALIGSTFKVKVTSRDNWLEIEGNARDTENALVFLAELGKFYKLRKSQLDLRDIELLARNSAPGKNTDIETLWQGKISVSPRKREVIARSKRQLEYISKIRKHDVTFGIGPAGTGKTYLAMACAVSAFLRQEVSRIILTRPARESGERLGFLPGTLEDKVSPYLRPLYDALHEMLSPDEAADLIARGVIEIAPLAFMRGRTLNDAFIILDEAQNTTVDQMLMFLTRMGFGSKCVITGDPSQSDLAPNERSGLRHAIDRLKNIPELGFTFFGTGDVVRHPLLEKIIIAYNSSPEGSKNA
ncbi:MAG: PhoH family protein [Lentisphaeria bacterium]|nr:PhoH family protein [Lentisphaerota bacterium]MBR2633942.1 PhoH family protein [Lentisphaeria bacterium]